MLQFATLHLSSLITAINNLNLKVNHINELQARQKFRFFINFRGALSNRILACLDGFVKVLTLFSFAVGSLSDLSSMHKVSQIV